MPPRYSILTPTCQYCGRFLTPLERETHLRCFSGFIVDLLLTPSCGLDTVEWVKIRMCHACFEDDEAGLSPEEP